MRIAYYHHWSEGKTSGVFKKLVAQTKQWVENGHEVAMFNLSSSATAEEWVMCLDSRVHFEQIVYENYRDQLFLVPRLLRRMILWKPNVVYQRYGAYHPAYEYVLRAVPVVVEINSDDLNEARHGSQRYYWWIRMTRGRWLKRVAGLVFVSNEVMHNSHFVDFNVPKTVVANGIDLSLYETLPPATNHHPRLIFIGSPKMRHHGTDKIIYMAEQFPTWSFDLIGPSANDFPYLPPNVTAHSMMKQEEYLPLVSRADVAIGSLALHRIDIHEISPLKMSEYLAWGLPVIAGYKDTNFMHSVDFILELPSTPGNVKDNLLEIKSFVERVKGKRVSREAILHIDSRHKEQERLKFFGTVLEQTEKSNL
jgi:hypothetical protein